MCGFFVLMARNGDFAESESRFRAAGELQHHRGPDSSGTLIEHPVAMYFRRLSILDLSPAADQPFFSEDRSTVLVMNGEIFNFKELRADLEGRGHSFRTTSDTEVLLRSYLHRGPEFLEHLRGMFAGVLWDKRNRSLLVFRDRLGIKPLYFFRNSEFLAFSSEIKSILHFFPESRTPNPRAAYKFLVRNFADDTSETFYEKIHAIPPGTLLTIQDDDIRETRYWEFPQGGGHRFDAEQFRERWEEVIRLHMRSDVPVSATLSGGMDSSSIVTTVAANHAAGSEFRVFSILPPETVDESHWIDETVNQSGVSHEYFAGTTDDPSQLMDAILSAHDEPFQYASCVYQFLLRQHLQERGIKVILVGEGADEYLAGYRRMVYAYLWALDRSQREAALEGSARLLKLASPQQVSSELERYQSTAERNLSGQENTEGHELVRETTHRAYDEFKNEPLYVSSNGDPRRAFYRLLEKHLRVRNLPFVLRMEDRNSMAFGIESRVPFLDHAFIEYVLSHDVEEFMKGGENKSMLRRAMKGTIPAAVLDRKEKTNRPGSHPYFMYRLVPEEMKDLLSSADGQEDELLSSGLTRRFSADCESDNRSRAETWFRVYGYLKWRRLQLGNRSTGATDGATARS